MKDNDIGKSDAVSPVTSSALHLHPFQGYQFPYGRSNSGLVRLYTVPEFSGGC